MTMRTDEQFNCCCFVKTMWFTNVIYGIIRNWEDDQFLKLQKTDILKQSVFDKLNFRQMLLFLHKQEVAGRIFAWRHEAPSFVFYSVRVKQVSLQRLSWFVPQRMPPGTRRVTAVSCCWPVRCWSLSCYSSSWAHSCAAGPSGAEPARDPCKEQWDVWMFVFASTFLVSSRFAHFLWSFVSNRLPSLRCVSSFDFSRAFFSTHSCIFPLTLPPVSPAVTLYIMLWLLLQYFILPGLIEPGPFLLWCMLWLFVLLLCFYAF